MANTPISDFPAASSVNASDVLAGVQDGVTKKFSFAIVLNWLKQQLESMFVPTSRKINGKDLSSDITLDASDVGAVDTAEVGVADGVAGLDSNGKVPSSQLPPIASDAADITYDPTTSGASATNVQDALDEVFDDLDGKQNKITASGILKGDGQGGVSAATAGTDYQAPLTAGTDYATPAQLADKANQSQIAYVETGTTTSRAYSVGEYFCWNGMLYRVTTAISNGGTINPGTNCEPKTVTTMPGSELVWTNPNPTSSFPDGTISIDLSRFTAIHIVFKGTASDSGVVDAHLTIDGATHTVAVFTLPPSGSAAVGLSRSFTPSATGIACGSGLVKTLLNGTRATENNRIVPQKIYGIY